MSGSAGARARRFARLAGAAVAAVGAFGLLREALGGVPLVPLAEPARLALTLLGASLLLLARRRRGWLRACGALLALGGALIGAGAAELPLLLRVAALGAGGSLLLLDVPGLARASEALAALPGAIGAALWMGWLYGATDLGVPTATPLAATALPLLLVLLGAGLLAARPERGLAELLASDTAGGSLVRRMLPLTFVIAVGFGWMRLTGVREGLLPIESGLVWIVLAGIVCVSVLIVRAGRYLDELERAGRRETLARRGAEHRFGELFENARDCIYVHDLAGNFTAINAAGEQLLGYGREELRRMNVSDVLAPESAQRVREALAEARGERPAQSEGDDALLDLEVVRKDGSRRPIEVSVLVIHEDGRPDRVEGIARDLSERRLLEEQLRQAQRLDAVGRLAGGIAHDLSSHLTTILFYIRLALERMPAEQPARADLEQVETAAGSAAKLIQQLLTFGRRQVQQRRILDLNAVVGPLGALLGRQLGERIETVLRLEAGLEPVRADPTQIEQVVMNLALNARDAMPGGGRLTLATRNVQLDTGAAARLPELAPGRYVVLSVSDTGSGMDADTQQRIFDPFFTTKEVGKGTGLGLATVYGIVKQSGGAIAVRSQPGGGTTMEVYLPQSEGGRP